MAFYAMENGVLAAQALGNPRVPRKPRAHEDEEQGKLFVGGLSWDTTQETLLRYFGRFGEVIDCVVMKNAESGRSRGFGFVTFSDPGNIEAVLSSCPHTLDGRTIDPKACNPRSMQKPKKTNFFPKVFLGGLPSNITETDLRNFFSRYGEVCEIIIMYDQEKKKSRGFGFLSFSDDQAVNRACAEHFVNIQNKQVEIKRAEPRAQAAAWGKEAVDQWGGPIGGVSGPPPITLGSPLQQQPHSNGGHHLPGSSGGVAPPPGGAPPYWGSGGNPPPNATHYAHPQYGSTQIVPWAGHQPPAAPTPPHSGSWGFASPPPTPGFPVYHPPPPPAAAAPSVTPNPSYWNQAVTLTTTHPQQTYGYGSYAIPNKAPDYYTPPPHTPNGSNPGLTPTNNPMPGVPPHPGAYNSELAVSGLGPQRAGTIYSSTTQPSQYHPYRRS
eukprot:TRINITY_DN1977_c0_g1_i1.p1 TRINITY_DN1977_c0_g1~~TRINITY_DN1977_c0_g1_i1.p1  ORF type:complete len:437 (+),score=124.52 TRINITY_DN1977_c0_g1_i1:356-1666(+)